MDRRIEFVVRYQGRMYGFDCSVKVYFFEVGVDWQLDKKFSMRGLEKFVDLVFEAYLRDDNCTPLGCLADYAAKNWKRVRRMDEYKLLDKFYEQHTWGW